MPSEAGKQAGRQAGIVKFAAVAGGVGHELGGAINCTIQQFVVVVGDDGTHDGTHGGNIGDGGGGGRGGGGGLKYSRNLDSPRKSQVN